MVWFGEYTEIASLVLLFGFTIPAYICVVSVLQCFHSMRKKKIGETDWCADANTTCNTQTRMQIELAKRTRNKCGTTRKRWVATLTWECNCTLHLYTQANAVCCCWHRTSTNIKHKMGESESIQTQTQVKPQTVQQQGLPVALVVSVEG